MSGRRGGRVFLSLDTNVSRANISKVIMKGYQIKNKKKMVSSREDYYNRPSLQSSYQIAVLAGIGILVMLGIIIVSEVV